MDARQPAFQRPPDRPMIHNPNHQPSPQAYATYPPPTSQPQQPLHVPFSQDPYTTARRDPFLPTTSQHIRRSSQDTPGGDNAPQAQSERQGGWTHTGTEYIFGFLSQAHAPCYISLAVHVSSGPVLSFKSTNLAIFEPSGNFKQCCRVLETIWTASSGKLFRLFPGRNCNLSWTLVAQSARP
jgi:hypothetical protein